MDPELPVIDHFIEPLSSLNSIDFVKRIFRKRGDVQILSRAGRSPGRCKQSRAMLDRRSQQQLCRRLSNPCGNCQNDRVFERPRPYSVTQWREGATARRPKHKVLILAEFLLAEFLIAEFLIAEFQGARGLYVGIRCRSTKTSLLRICPLAHEQ
jgi:hypothetical protein